VSESLWTLEDGVLHIQLAKAQADTTWASAIAGHELRADQQQEDQKRLLLERFQQEVRGCSEVMAAGASASTHLGSNSNRCWLWLPLWGPVQQHSAAVAGAGAKVASCSTAAHHRLHPALPPLQHPGFDFSSAEFSGGEVPDPRTFLRDQS
jgi:hypothetical protein